MSKKCVICGAPGLTRTRCEQHLDVYVPAGPTIQAFHDDTRFVKAIIGPFGCLRASTPIITEKGLIPISEISEPVRVLSWCNRAQRFKYKKASASFKKGVDRLYEVVTTRGRFVAAKNHQVLCKDEEYRAVTSLEPGQELHPGGALLSQYGFESNSEKRLVVSIEQLSTEEDYWDISVPETENYVIYDGSVHHNSSKSVACCYDLLFNAMLQPKQRDGKRRSRYAIARSTYRELEDTTIRTFLDWFGDFGTYKVSNNSFLMRYGDVEAEFLFRALDKPEDVEKLLSTEYTRAWINEARDVSEAILKGLTGRVGRYPSEKDGGCINPGVILDSNPPDEDESNWMYRLFEVDMFKDPQMQELYALYKQPPGAVLVNDRWEDNWGQVPGIPKAENIENLVEGYYTRMCVGKPREWIKVYAEGKYGFVQDGKPVFTQYNDDLHCVEFDADPDLPLYLGFDAGLTPACVIVQLSKRGQLRVVDELIAKDMGMYNFAKDVVKPHLATHYPNYSYHGSWADPSKTRSEANEQTAVGILNDQYEEMSINMPVFTTTALTNSIPMRLDAVNQYLTKLIDGAPGFLLHPRCAVLRKGFLGRYRYERVQASGDERYKEQPKKNAYSHVHDSLQYVCLGTLGDTDLEDDGIDYNYPQTATSYSGR